MDHERSQIAKARAIHGVDGVWRGDPRAHFMRMKAALGPAVHKSLGIEGPLDRFRHER